MAEEKGATGNKARAGKIPTIWCPTPTCCSAVKIDTNQSDSVISGFLSFSVPRPSAKIKLRLTCFFSVLANRPARFSQPTRSSLFGTIILGQCRRLLGILSPQRNQARCSNHSQSIVRSQRNPHTHLHAQEQQAQEEMDKNVTF